MTRTAMQQCYNLQVGLAQSYPPPPNNFCMSCIHDILLYASECWAPATLIRHVWVFYRSIVSPPHTWHNMAYSHVTFRPHSRP